MERKCERHGQERLQMRLPVVGGYIVAVAERWESRTTPKYQPAPPPPSWAVTAQIGERGFDAQTRPGLRKMFSSPCFFWPPCVSSISLRINPPFRTLFIEYVRNGCRIKHSSIVSQICHQCPAGPLAVSRRPCSICLLQPHAEVSKKQMHPVHNEVGPGSW